MNPHRSGAFRTVLVSVAALIAFPSSTLACYAVVAGKKATADGSVLVGHNEINGGRRVLNFRAVPRRSFDKGAELKLGRGGVFPRVRETWAFLWSENPGLEFSDAYLNEWGVAVMSDGCPSREDGYEALASRGEIRDGGIGYMLRRLVAERAKTAREGVELAGTLVERFGYVGSGRTYILADPDEAWLLSVVRGRRWAACRVPDDRVVLVPNVYVLGELDLKNPDTCLASADIVSWAVKRGWFDPEGGKSFRFDAAFSAAGKPVQDPRRLAGRRIVSGKEDAAAGPLSFGVVPREKLTVASVIALLRIHEGPVSICNGAAQEGAVFQLRSDLPRPVGCVWWRTTAEPCLSVLVPFYLGLTGTPEEFFRPAPIETVLTLEHHFHPPRGTFEPAPDSAWWAFKNLQDLVRRKYEQRLPLVRKAWDEIEAKFLEEQGEVEKKAKALWKENPEAARAFLTDLGHMRCNEVLEQARALALEFGK